MARVTPIWFSCIDSNHTLTQTTADQLPDRHQQAPNKQEGTANFTFYKRLELMVGPRFQLIKQTD